MNVIFKTQSGKIEPATLSRIDLAEFRAVAERLFGSIENVRFLVKGQQINTDDASKFLEKKDLFREKCVIQLVQRMKGGYLRIHSATPNLFKIALYWR